MFNIAIVTFFLGRTKILSLSDKFQPGVLRGIFGIALILDRRIKDIGSAAVAGLSISLKS